MTEGQSNNYIVCDTCKQKLHRDKFSGSYGNRSTTCYTCNAEKKSAKVQAELAARKAARTKQRFKKAAVKRLQTQAAAKPKTAAEKQQSAEERAEQQAKLELASRELARRSLLHFTERNVKDYMPGWVHEDICRRLEQFMRDIEAKKSPRLMLALPPRIGKSELASTQFPAWMLGHHPEWEVISSSYSVDLPIGFSRLVRAMLSSPEYNNLFPTTKLSDDSKAAEAWRTTQRGGFRAAGVGGGITGMGAHCLILDDVVKDEAEAESELLRNRAWNWYGATAYTRLSPGGGVLVIGTRWHDDDVSGRLEMQMAQGLKEIADLEAEIEELLPTRHEKPVLEAITVLQEQLRLLRASVDHWDIVKYPAIAETDQYLDRYSGAIVAPEDMEALEEGLDLSNRYKLLRKKGEALHPARFPLPLMLRYKRTLQPRHWSALYQQNPVPDEGMFFTRDMFSFSSTPPAKAQWQHMTTFIAWDLAISLKATSDYTVGVVGALDAKDNLWIIDVIRGRWDTDGIAELIIDTHIKYGAHMTGIEKTALELAIKPTLERRMKERKEYILLAEGKQALRPITDKIMRARPLQGRMQQGSVTFPERAPWLEALQHELLRFPSGIRDDQVDALAWLVRMAAWMPLPQALSERLRSHSPDGFKSWRDRLSSLMDRGAARKNFMTR